jgi:uncharacterized membrane protein
MPLPIWLEAALFFAGFGVVVPAIAAVIGYSAWRGRPKNWDRSMYWTAFAVSIIASAALMVYAQRMRADVRTWQYPVQMTLLGLGIIMFGIAGGCMVGIFMYGRGKGPIWRDVTQRTGSTADSHANQDQDRLNNT